MAKAVRCARGTVQARVTHLSNHLSNLEKQTEFTTSDIFDVEERLCLIRPAVHEYIELHKQLLSLLDENEVDQRVQDEKKYSEFDNLFYRTVARARDFLCKHSSVTRDVGSCSPSSFSASNAIKLPKITLPKFSGVQNSWLEFRDKYSSLIHTNQSINDIQRFHYLRSCLEGEAALVIGDVDFTSENYEQAWKILNNRYNNSRVLIHNHIKAVFDSEPLVKESAVKLRSLLDVLTKHIGALERLSKNTDDLYAALITFVITSKLDATTAREWEESQEADKVPTIDSLKTFLREKADLLSTLEIKRATSCKSSVVVKSRTATNVYHTQLETDSALKCLFCKQNHLIRNCTGFLRLSPNERYQKMKALNRCINCLRHGHTFTACRSSGCRKCDKKHHTLLHFETTNLYVEMGNEAPSASSVSNDANLSQALTANQCHPCIILSTAIINIFDKYNRPHTVRALLDNGSQSNFITQALAAKLGLKMSTTNIAISGIGASSAITRYTCVARLSALHSNYSFSSNYLVLPSITGQVPIVRINSSTWRVPNNLVLADPSYNIPGSIDVLLGAEHFMSLLCVGQIKLANPGPILQKTRLGWIMSGRAAGFNSFRETVSHLSTITLSSLKETIERFWEVEEIGAPIEVTAHDPCEIHFQTTTSRTSNGRFIVNIPVRNIRELGSTKEFALRRFYNLERMLERNPTTHEKYHEFIREYISLGHMSLSDDNVDGICSFLPHHAVCNEASLTTKLRVVFDGSLKSTTGKSLNDCQYTGPTIQADLFAILLRFRTHAFVVSADVTKMYRQILIDPPQRRLQQIFWRFDKNNPVQSYTLNTVTYGTTSAAFLAIRCLFQIANEISRENPYIAERIRQDFYVDDLLSGADSIDEARSLIRNIDDALRTGCFVLRKWMSNSSEVLRDVPNSDTNPLQFGENGRCKTLGLQWTPTVDQLSYSIKPLSVKTFTKRTILSCIAQIFDPLGLLSACTITAKIIMQKLWGSKVGWDESLPQALVSEWCAYHSQLNHLNQICTPRRVILSSADPIEIHGFADASLKAYGACVYLKQDNHILLYCAKSKVAPLKSLSIPRLELCAALLLARLVQRVIKEANVNVSKTYLWSDSSVVLAWLKQCPSTLQTFVANRVAEIQRSAEARTWRHIQTADNPADLCSRGVHPANLINCDHWWHGPKWLSLPANEWPVSIIEVSNIPELRSSRALVCNNACFGDCIDFSRFSSLGRLLRTVAYILRFGHNARHGKDKRWQGYISQEERERARILLLKIVQNYEFKPEIQSLQQDATVKTNSRLLSLAPFLDESGLVRVGGRLQRSKLPYDVKHPILLPHSHYLTILIFRDEHQKLFHIGPLGLLNSIRQTYWPISGRNIARKIVHSCIICFRVKPRIDSQQMGALPTARVAESFPFSHCGVDYAGPFSLKSWHGRGCKTYKGYIALFICMVTKAIHLELVTELTTAAFIATLRRMIARRGKPSIMYSDNGTNFVGANRELAQLIKVLKKQETQKAIDSEGIEWKFIPPRSPHFGGLWEAGVKSCKYHLRRVIGAQLLTYEDFSTLLTQIEAILNSRPLTQLSSDPHDLLPLTPAHFLVGRHQTPLSDKNYINTNILSRYQYAQSMAQHFWTRWHRDYLNTLQQRTKWRSRRPDTLQVDDLVIIKEENLPPMLWRMGRVTQLHPGADGITRVVTLRTQHGEMKRARRYICPLPKTTDG